MDFGCRGHPSPGLGQQSMGDCPLDRALPPGEREPMPWVANLVPRARGQRSFGVRVIRTWWGSKGPRSFQGGRRGSLVCRRVHGTPSHMGPPFRGSRLSGQQPRAAGLGASPPNAEQAEMQDVLAVVAEPWGPGPLQVSLDQQRAELAYWEPQTNKYRAARIAAQQEEQATLASKEQEKQEMARRIGQAKQLSLEQQQLTLRQRAQLAALRSGSSNTGVSPS